MLSGKIPFYECFSVCEGHGHNDGHDLDDVSDAFCSEKSVFFLHSSRGARCNSKHEHPVGEGGSRRSLRLVAQADREVVVGVKPEEAEGGEGDRECPPGPAPEVMTQEALM